MEPKLIETTWKTDVQYHEFTCSECGETARNTYSEPYRANMLERRLCWTCNFWRDFEEKELKNLTKLTIISGHVYTPGNATSGAFRGMAGRRFDIEYVEPSEFAGKRITTFDLWSGSTIPEKLRSKFPDTARFLGNAEKVVVGDTACWNPSAPQTEPYPLPRTLGLF